MIHPLTIKDLLIISGIIFALFVGAGNIIFPPMVGIQAGEYIWYAALGFLTTSVGLPLITLVALARVGGRIDDFSAPIGKLAGCMLAMICYLIVGPLFAIPRTSTVSFDIGLAPLIGDGQLPLFIYSLIYFGVVIFLSLNPGALLETLGNILAPLKIVVLSVLGLTAVCWPVGDALISTPNLATSSLSQLCTYKSEAFSHGLVSGYLTMDTLGVLVFSVVIINAVRARIIGEVALLTRYTIISGMIASIGLIIIYLALIKIGANSYHMIEQNANGAIILHEYIQHIYGRIGILFLSFFMGISCIVTAVGLTCACADFFARYFLLSYRHCVYIVSISSLVFSNFGLNYLITIFTPILIAIYPPCIVLVFLSFTLRWWNNSKRIVLPVMLVSLMFGILDAAKKMNVQICLPKYLLCQLPLTEQGLEWVLPVLLVLVFVGVYDRLSTH
ncbi:Branched-chain amino acid transport system 2 carrier protein [Candidatus Erwinia haradaeae]|uniref:Branched-chain amino acid transport system carrier protein n=1 Tax=Candidatus Erwinia haradaeae TaxID=1922217 RepID=A0A451DDB9_9GAMM|nr:branched-chain amino acid transport system II carrier protein [Candidatus Erwinia haradaeae]VFP84469.1 Branched-chain amino acid transport system 2 carrier protein [Candidatus Erwinia haradaeae]